MNRRLFLSRAAAMSAVAGVPGLWQRAARAAGPNAEAPILVVVELSGGNDGLNTVIPYRDDAYHRARPTLRVAPDKVLKLDDALGLHPAMTGLHKLWGDGKLRVLMNVGYPKPSRSHFRSMEIWQSGVLAATPTTGWIGRASDSPEAQAPPCFVGSGTTPLAIRGREIAPFSLADIASLRLRPGAKLDLAPDVGDPSGPSHRVAQAMEAAGAISDQVAAIRPDNLLDDRDGLDAKFTTIGHLIESGVGSRVYYTSLDGFDTHVSQEFAHQDLLRKLSVALERFQTDLAMKKLDDRVVVVVFSEFGRRIQENGSKGTDHGAAAPVFLIGSPVAGGLLGNAPDLMSPVEGDVAFKIDFRDVYASLLADWLRVDPSSVIDRDQNTRINLFRA